jgi:hypothetical protein
MSRARHAKREGAGGKTTPCKDGCAVKEDYAAMPMKMVKGIAAARRAAKAEAMEADDMPMVKRFDRKQKVKGKP